MNYRDFFKNKKATAKDIQSLIPEGVDQKEFNKGIGTEKEHTDDEFIAAKIAGDHLKEDPHYYTKLYGAGLKEGGYEDIDGVKYSQSELDPDYAETGPQPSVPTGFAKDKTPDLYKDKLDNDSVEEHCGACEDDMGGMDVEDDYDDNDGLPKVGGALAVPHVGQPIMMGKIIQVGGEFKGGCPASGELSGMTNCAGVNKDKGGIPVQPVNDKEPITAGGKSIDSSIVSKSVGGSVVPGEGQKQGGPNSQGTIAATAKLNESKNKIRKIVKEVLKEIRYNKTTGKWEKINEETVNMKMGASYKTVQPRQYKVMDDDTARTNQYEPEITEMYDDEEETIVNERYVELANKQRNLSETELAELKTLREKIENIQIARRNNGLSTGGTEPSLYENGVNRKCMVCGKEYNPKQTGTYYYCPECDEKASQVDAGEEATTGRYEESVNMKMGPSYKTIQPRMYKVSDDDVARTNQYDPQIQENDGFRMDANIGSSEADPTDYEKCDGCGHQNMNCRCNRNCAKCGNKLDSAESNHGDFCNGCSNTVKEAGGQSVQHRSFRTAKDIPQDPKVRWDDEVNEGQSKVAKTIAKGQKGKKSTFSQSLKHKKPKKTSSGVHKRKP